jgi:hypothetical protein
MKNATSSATIAAVAAVMNTAPLRSLAASAAIDSPAKRPAERTVASTHLRQRARRRVAIAGQQRRHHLRLRRGDEALARRVLRPEQVALQPVGRMRAPVRHALAVLARQPREFVAHLSHRKRALDPLRQHQPHLDQVHRRRQHIGGDVLRHHRARGLGGDPLLRHVGTEHQHQGSTECDDQLAGEQESQGTHGGGDRMNGDAPSVGVQAAERRSD